jgi:hypothetical protein
MKRQIVIGIIVIALSIILLFIFQNEPNIVKLGDTKKVSSNKNQKLAPSTLDTNGCIGDTLWLSVSATKLKVVNFSISGKLKKGDVPIKSGVFISENDFLAALDMTDYFKEVSKLKLSIRDELLDLIGSNSKLQEPDIFIKWNGFIKDIDISKKLPEFPAIYNFEEEQIIRNSKIGSNYVNCIKLEQNTQKFFFLNKNKGFIWEVKKKVGDEVKANECIMSIVQWEDLVFSSADDYTSNSSLENYDLFNTKGQKIGTLSSLHGSNLKFKLDKIAINSESIDLKGKFYILLSEDN